LKILSEYVWLTFKVLTETIMKMVVFWNVVWCSFVILTDISEELTASIFRVEAVSSSETSVNIYQTTRCNIPEDSHLQ
jgi:hypothetical protein